MSLQYSLEISGSGLVNPMDPLISTEILNRDIKDVWSDVNALLLFAFYYLNEEIYEIIGAITAPSLHHHCTIASPSLHHRCTLTVGLTFKQYFYRAGWLNVLDWFGLISAYGSYYLLGTLVTITVPSRYRHCAITAPSL